MAIFDVNLFVSRFSKETTTNVKASGYSMKLEGRVDKTAADKDKALADLAAAQLADIKGKGGKELTPKGNEMRENIVLAPVHAALLILRIDPIAEEAERKAKEEADKAAQHNRANGARKPATVTA